MSKYEQSIKALESAKKGLKGVVDKIDKQVENQLEKMGEFNERIQEYDKAIKVLQGRKR